MLNHYNKHLDYYSIMRHRYIDQVFSALDISVKGEWVLDLGCGTGAFCNACQERGATFAMGVDFAQQRIIRAMETYPKGHFMCADVHIILTALGGVFDIKTFWDVLEHFTTTDARHLIHLAMEHRGSRVFASIPLMDTSEMHRAVYDDIHHVKEVLNPDIIISRLGPDSKPYALCSWV